MVTNILTCGAWVLIVFGVFHVSVNANHIAKSPCPTAADGKEISAGKDIKVDKDIKNSAIQDEAANMKGLTYELVPNLKGQLENNDNASVMVAPLCDTFFNKNNYDKFEYRISGANSKCGAPFCSDVRAVLQNDKICPDDSDNLKILQDHTRCVKHKHTINSKKEGKKDYQDVCVCAYCDNKNKNAFFYLFFEYSFDNPGIYFYMRVENPYTLGETELDKNFEFKIDNPETRKSITLKMYALLNSDKYPGLYKPTQDSSNCDAGAIMLKTVYVGNTDKHKSS